MIKNYILFPLFLIFLLLLTLYNLDDITDFTADLISQNKVVTRDAGNEYETTYDYVYVQNTDSFVPYDKQDIMNIFYTVLNAGYDSFTFYCPSEYTLCIFDIQDVTNNQTIITDISNFVHPFNSFSSIRTTTDVRGEVTFEINKMYTEEMIDVINEKLDEIFDELNITEETDVLDAILLLHDYIIDNTYYDKEGGENSGNAYGTLIEGKSKCAGYADTMAIVLSRLGLQNFKVASEDHVWNAVYIDGEWLQIDLTWDDPIVTNGTTITETIRHKFYMIDTETILSYNTSEHDFDTSVYAELKSK